MSFHPVKRVDLTGYRSGDLEALSYHSQDRSGRALWTTKCHYCDTIHVIAGYALRGVTPLKKPKTHCGCRSQRSKFRKPVEKPVKAPKPYVRPPDPKPGPRTQSLSTASMVTAMRLARSPIRDIIEVTGLTREEILTIINQTEKQ